MNIPWLDLRQTAKAFKEDWPLFVLMFLSFLVLLVHIYEDYDGGIRSNDIHTYVQYARNIADGKGFIRNTLASSEAWASGPIPKPVKIFFHPLLIYLFYLFSGEWIQSAIWLTCSLYLITVPLLYLFAHEIFDRRVAVLSCLFFIFNRYTLLFSLYGGSDPLFAFLLLFSLFVLVKSTKPWHLVAVGILASMANATRQVGFMYAVPIFLLVFFQFRKSSRKLGSVVFFVVGWVIFSKFSWFMNTVYYGNSHLYGIATGGYSSGPLICHSSVYPGYSATKVLGFPTDPLKMILGDSFVREAFYNKCAGNLNSLIRNIVSDLAANLYLGLFFLAGLIFNPVRRLHCKLRWLIISFLLVNIFVGIVFLYNGRYLYPLVPYVIVWGAGFVSYVVGKVSKKKRFMGYALWVVCICLILFPFHIGWSIDAGGMFTMKERRARSMSPYERFGKFFQKVAGSKTVIVADGPWIPDFYGGGGRIIVMNPRTLRMMALLHRNKMDVDAIVLTSAYCARRGFPEWKHLYYHPQPFNGFVPHTFESDGLRAVVYVRDSKLLSDALCKSGFESVDKGDYETGMFLLGRAVQIDPRNHRAILKLRETQGKLRMQGQKLYLRVREKADNSMRTYRKLCEVLACGYGGGGIKQMYGNVTDSLVNRGVLKLVRFTNNKHFGVKTTLSGFPCGNWATDGISLSNNGIYVGGDVDVCFDLGTARHVDAVVVKAYLSKRNSLTDMKIFSSLDGYNYTLEKQLAGTVIKERAYHVLALNDLNIFARFVKLSAFGDEVKVQSLPLRIDEVELWGYAASEERKMGEHSKSLRLVKASYEVESFYIKTGTRVKDAHASGNRAVFANVSEDKPDLLAFGRYELLPPGNYKALFRLKVDRNDPYKEVARIDACGGHGRKMFAVRSLFGSDFNCADKYQDFVLPFSIFEENKVEFRVYYYSAVSLWADRIELNGELFEYYYNTPSGAIERWHNRKVHVSVSYETESLFYGTGHRIFDPDASGKYARQAQIFRDDAGCLVFGPYQKYSPGNYRATFRLKVLNNSTQDTIANLDVCTDRGKLILVEKSIRGTDFEDVWKYQDFELTFPLGKPSELEFRVYFCDVVDLWADCITVERLSDS